MELEHVLSAEFARLCSVVDGVSREIAQPRPWYVRLAARFLSGVL